MPNVKWHLLCFPVSLQLLTHLRVPGYPSLRQSPTPSGSMSKYALPDVVYRGYIVTPSQFTNMMMQIPEYKDVYENAGYGVDDHIFRYVYWKKIMLKEALRVRAPRIKEHREPGVPLSNPPTHIMILSSYLKVKSPELLKDAKLLLETENDRKNLEAIVKFFQLQGMKELRGEDFEYVYSVGDNPKLITNVEVVAGTETHAFKAGSRSQTPYSRSPSYSSLRFPKKTRMNKYAAPDVVYRGYIVTADQFTEMMKQIPAYKDLMENGGYGYDNHIMCYAHWKILVLDDKKRSLAPKIKEHWDSSTPKSDPPSHIMLLSSFIKEKRPDLVKDRDLLLETERDRKSLGAMVKFFQHRGILDLKEEDFQYTYSVGPNPILITFLELASRLESSTIGGTNSSLLKAALRT
ncbi:hypothetical protein NMY22_g15522 [Coprinellus aureogranulatus]|nr:hypothetical protein NMY22_g15522 [Coprinellus aureogranulatus]